jgi:hypothetical protein
MNLTNQTFSREATLRGAKLCRIKRAQECSITWSIYGVRSLSQDRLTGGGRGGLLATVGLVVLSSDLLEIVVVCLEVLVLDQLYIKLGLLRLTLLVILLAVHVDGLSSDFLELSIVVSKIKN